MPINDFFPFQEGQIVTVAQWNELISKILDGSALTGANVFSNLEDRVAVLEARVDSLSSKNGFICRKEQFILTANQQSVVLHSNMIPDSEVIFYNSIVLVKRDLPNNEPGDYYLEDNVIKFTPEMYNEIEGGEYLIVSYWSAEI